MLVILITADHTVLSEGCESRNNHRKGTKLMTAQVSHAARTAHFRQNALVVHDLATQLTLPQDGDTTFPPGRRTHLRRTVVAQSSFQSFCHNVHSDIDFTHHAWLKARSTLSALHPKTLIPHRAMSYTLPHLTTPRTGTPSSPVPESVFQRAEQPCKDRRPQLSGAQPEQTPFTTNG